MKSIPLTSNIAALIDDEDAEIVGQYRWYLSPQTNTCYAFIRINRNGKRSSLYMHQLIMQPQAGEQVDHINGDGLDNRRSNLRVCSIQQNLRNTSKHTDSASRFKGVSYKKSAKRWEARISIEGKQTHIGYFENEEDAARAYDRVAREKIGAFARLNFP